MNKYGDIGQPGQIPLLIEKSSEVWPLFMTVLSILLYIKQDVLIGGQQVALLGDKQVVLIQRQRRCPYQGTNRLPLLGDKQDALIGEQTGCCYWLAKRLPILGDKQYVLIGNQTGCPYLGSKRMILLGNKYCKGRKIHWLKFSCFFLPIKTFLLVEIFVFCWL